VPIPIFLNPDAVEEYKDQQRKRALDVVSSESQRIDSVAKKYGIRREAIAGAILWEGIVNAKPPWHPSKPSLGNIHTFWWQPKGGSRVGGTSDALIVERLGLVTPAARNMDELRARLNDPKWAPIYIGGIMRYHADNYKKFANVDISQNVGVLTFLFNAGDSEKRAKEFAELRKRFPGRTPSYFGFIKKDMPNMGTWSVENLGFIRKVLGGNKNYTTVMRTSTDPYGKSALRIKVSDPLKQGTQGAPIRSLQRLLNYKHGAGLQEDGYFGPKTRDALKRIQKSYGLKQTGVFDKKTRNTFLKPPPILKSGARGSYVSDVQRSLNSKLGVNLKQDGIFGPKTKSAVKSLQRLYGLRNDGILGPKTTSALSHKVPKTLQSGSKGASVTELQKLLNRKGYSIRADGTFGRKTQAAVANFQRRNHLKVDGIVGPKTWRSMFNSPTRRMR
jgi:peptidoglycan hydrolase-like protein with peptidoglycan-binding domain